MISSCMARLNPRKIKQQTSIFNVPWLSTLRQTLHSHHTVISHLTSYCLESPQIQHNYNPPPYTYTPHPSQRGVLFLSVCVCVCLCHAYVMLCIRVRSHVDVCVLEGCGRDGGGGVDGSRWVSAPAAATSTLGQLMFSELTGIPSTPASTRSDVRPSSLLAVAWIDCPCNWG